jgi:hypothetical protein
MSEMGETLKPMAVNWGTTPRHQCVICPDRAQFDTMTVAQLVAHPHAYICHFCDKVCCND